MGRHGKGGHNPRAAGAMRALHSRVMSRQRTRDREKRELNLTYKALAQILSNQVKLLSQLDIGTKRLQKPSLLIIQELCDE